MTDLNADDFFKDAAIALTRLYATFPRPVAVYVEDVYGTEETDEFGMHSARYLACFATLVFLAEEGFLRFDECIRQDAIDQAVLSARAFTLLSMPQPGSGPVESEHTVVAGLREALKSRSSSEVRTAMLDLMKAFLPD